MMRGSRAARTSVLHSSVRADSLRGSLISNERVASRGAALFLSVGQFFSRILGMGQRIYKDMCLT